MRESIKSEKQKYHPDILLFLILIPFISAFNYYLTYSNIQLNGFLLLTYTIDTVQGYLAWISVRGIILYLDRKIPFEPYTVKRIVIQVVSTTLAGLLIIILTTELVSMIVRGEPANISFYTLDVLIISIWFLVINGIYIGLHYRHAFEEIQKSQSPLKSDFFGINVRLGNQDLLIKESEVASIKVDNQVILLITRTGKKYVLDESLDHWENVLPERDFFRLNRQTILNRETISGFKRLENGKLQVQIKPEMDNSIELGISRTKAPSFRTWFSPKQ